MLGVLAITSCAPTSAAYVERVRAIHASAFQCGESEVEVREVDDPKRVPNPHGPGVLDVPDGVRLFTARGCEPASYACDSEEDVCVQIFGPRPLLSPR